MDNSEMRDMIALCGVSDPETTAPADTFEDRFWTAFEASDLQDARIALQKHNDTTVDISHVEIDAALRGSGNGDRLMAMITSLADECGVTLFASPAFDVDDDAETAENALRTWYEGWGFAPTDHADAELSREPSKSV